MTNTVTYTRNGKHHSIQIECNPDEVQKIFESNFDGEILTINGVEVVHSDN
ncbi:MAG: hypothetical protein PHQ11_04860 [Paludibacter sp.]|nr:hypothetical protein [Paludibacter sp.]